jgi:hypothetical protein
MFNLADDFTETGNLRETFFFNQTSYHHHVKAAKNADFIVDGKYVFEVGGRNKQQKQLQELEQAFIVKDGIEIGSGNIIPLWMFGFLY